MICRTPRLGGKALAKHLRVAYSGVLLTMSFYKFPFAGDNCKLRLVIRVAKFADDVCNETFQSKRRRLDVHTDFCDKVAAENPSLQRAMFVDDVRSICLLSKDTYRCMNAVKKGRGKSCWRQTVCRRRRRVGGAGDESPLMHCIFLKLSLCCTMAGG